MLHYCVGDDADYNLLDLKSRNTLDLLSDVKCWWRRRD
jgi:hypothetical protein